MLLKVSLDSIRCFNMGTPQSPLPANYVLDSAEVSVIREKIHVFNDKLRSVAVAKNLAFADMNSFYKSVQSGVLFNGNNFKLSGIALSCSLAIASIFEASSSLVSIALKTPLIYNR